MSHDIAASHSALCVYI